MAEELIRTNATIASAKSDPRLLDYIRVTSLKEFDECPDKWRVKYLEGYKQKESSGGAANIGTAVHDLVEMQIRSIADPELELDEERFLRNFNAIPKSEESNVMEYLKNLTLNDDYELLGVELEWEYHMFDDMPLIRGHIDAVYRTPDMQIIIVDHKTNRSHNNESWWANQLQPQLYAWAVSKMFEGRGITFRIGYVNLGYNVEWDISPQDIARTERRVRELWEKMVQYSRDYDKERIEYPGAHWPRTINDHCNWCPIKANCTEYQQGTTNFAKSFEQRMEMTVSQQLEFVKTIKKLVVAKEDDLEAEIWKKIDASPNGEFVDGDTVWQTYQKSQRHIIASHLLGVLGSLLSEEILDAGTYKSHLDELFTAKVTGVDRLIKENKQLKGVMESIMLQKPVGNGTLKSSKITGGTEKLGIKPAAGLLEDTSKGVD